MCFILNKSKMGDKVYSVVIFTICRDAIGDIFCNASGRSYQ